MQQSGIVSYRGREEIGSIFNSDILNLLLKTNGRKGNEGEDRGWNSDFPYFVAWGA